MKSQSEFDEEAKMYAWAPLGCGNYAPNFFGTSVPEVVEVRENPDGTVTLTVNAVCDMVICDDALITHDLTVKFKEDGSFQYLGNEIRKEDRNNVPEYQYRVKGEIKNGTVTLTVNAVCDMVICDDALITHDLTVKFKEDGSFQYLGNEIRKEDRNNVPEYQYRVKGEIKNGS